MAGVLNLMKTHDFWVWDGLGPFQKKENNGLFEKMTAENSNSQKSDSWKFKFCEKGQLKMQILLKGGAENANSELKL